MESRNARIEKMMNTAELSRLCKQYGLESLYILPSSIHEVIVVEADEDNLYSYQSMVKEINETTVEPIERLSDTVYEFDCKTGEISIA